VGFCVYSEDGIINFHKINSFLNC